MKKKTDGRTERRAVFYSLDIEQVFYKICLAVELLSAYGCLYSVYIFVFRNILALV